MSDSENYDGTHKCPSPMFVGSSHRGKAGVAEDLSSMQVLP